MTKLLLVPDGHYYRLPDGRVFVDSVFDYNFFKRYLRVFECVGVVARITEIQELPTKLKQASGQGIVFEKIPSFKGPINYLKKYFRIKSDVNNFINKYDCAIFRIPGATANSIIKMYMKTNYPYAVEVVTDPWTHFAPGTIKNKLRPLIRIVWTNDLRKICKVANGVSYVTESYLQSNYPSGIDKGDKSNSRFESYYSSVSLSSNNEYMPKKYEGKKTFIISHTANAFTSYGKGHIILMKALKIVRDKGYDVRIRFIGDGPMRIEFENYALKNGIEKYISFVGKLASGQEVINSLTETDLFVFPTMSEGLPRAILEAMSVGLPCISTPVCGIPEIIDESWLVEFNDVDGFAKKIILLISDIDLMEKISEENINCSKQYEEDILNIRRDNFYKKLKELVI